MNDAIDSSLRDLNDCGCCEGLDASTPVEVFNRPGLSAIAYRIGTHSQFKESMLAGLSSSELPALAGLKTRNDDDFSIALLDAWATTADVLTFYQERIANESYLRTATERFSLLQLARLIGYELRPGVAASTYLAFTLEDAPGAPSETTIDAGVKVQSMPGPGEQAQTFETIEKITARPSFNAIKPRLTREQTLTLDLSPILFKGADLNLKVGDNLLIVVKNSDGSLGQKFRRIRDVDADQIKGQTRVEFEGPQSPPPPVFGLLYDDTETVFSFTPQPLNNSTIKNSIFNRSVRHLDLSAYLSRQGWSRLFVYANIRAQGSLSSPQPADLGAFAFRTHASLFGHNAPDWLALPDEVRERYLAGQSDVGDWPIVISSLPQPILNLDKVYNLIVPGGWVVITPPLTVLGTNEQKSVFSVAEATETGRSGFALSAKITRLTLDTNFIPLQNFFQFRETTVYAQSERLELAELPISNPVGGSVIELDTIYEDLRVGQAIIVSGEIIDPAGVKTSELVTIASTSLADSSQRTAITLVKGLTYQYKPETVTINANVALASHGETTSEVLGSGDATQSFQQFTLKQPPLTHTSAQSPSGAETTLQVRVNDLLWHEVPSFFGHSPNERIYITRLGDDGKTTVQFGDGRTGARLPTGQENIRAVYRKGIGRGGLVKAGQLSQLLTRPLGVKGATNPEAATGAADAETLADIRRNAPLTVLTLDRIVSLRDYEDFARAFAGIAKALATWTWDGQVRGVFVTVASVDGAAVAPESMLYQNLLAEMKQAGDPFIPLRLQTYRNALFRLSAGVKVDPDFLSERVLAAVKQNLRAHFSFAARSLGQDVTQSEVVAVIQAVAGVTAVDLDKLSRFNEAQIVNERLRAAAPQAGAQATVAAAELLFLDADETVELRVI